MQAVNDISDEENLEFSELCLVSDLVLASTLVPSRDIHKEPWNLTDSKTKEEINCFGISLRFRSSVQDARAHQAPDDRSNQNLCIAKLKLKLRKTNFKQNVAKKSII